MSLKLSKAEAKRLGIGEGIKREPTRRRRPTDAWAPGTLPVGENAVSFHELQPPVCVHCWEAQGNRFVCTVCDISISRLMVEYMWAKGASRPLGD